VAAEARPKRIRLAFQVGDTTAPGQAHRAAAALDGDSSALLDLQIAVSELVANAVRYAPPGANAEISLTIVLGMMTSTWKSATPATDSILGGRLATGSVCRSSIGSRTPGAWKAANTRPCGAALAAVATKCGSRTGYRWTADAFPRDGEPARMCDSQAQWI
jgi:hypothetical protein